jgi:hypothetical protein
VGGSANLALDARSTTSYPNLRLGGLDRPRRTRPEPSPSLPVWDGRVARPVKVAGPAQAVMGYSALCRGCPKQATTTFAHGSLIS